MRDANNEWIGRGGGEPVKQQAMMLESGQGRAQRMANSNPSQATGN